VANKALSAALRLLARRTEIVDLPTFWDALGRPDLREVERADQLFGAGVYPSILYEAKRVIARRLEAAKPEETIELGDGATARVIRKDRSKPAPLTRFLLSGENYGDGHARYFERRPTKGWRWSVADGFEVEAWIKQGVTLYADLPGRGEIRKRSVA
jgi:hypothetical protein